MNERRRMAYLDAIGIDSYVSRAQLPGAAITHRLALIAIPDTEIPTAPAAAAGSREQVSSPVSVLPASIRDAARPGERATHDQASQPQVPGQRSQTVVPPLRFRLNVIVSGAWIWLEDLGDQPLTSDQVHLVHALAHALDRLLPHHKADAGKPLISSFDWPIHNNRQLDSGEDAARAGLTSYLSRQVEQHCCSGVVVMGEAGQKYVGTPPRECGRLIKLPASGQLLAEPLLKREVWQELLTVVARS